MPTCMQSEAFAIVSNVAFRRHAGLKHSDKVAAFDLVGFFFFESACALPVNQELTENTNQACSL